MGQVPSGLKVSISFWRGRHALHSATALWTCGSLSSSPRVSTRSQYFTGGTETCRSLWEVARTTLSISDSMIRGLNRLHDCYCFLTRIHWAYSGVIETMSGVEDNMPN